MQARLIAKVLGRNGEQACDHEPPRKAHAVRHALRSKPKSTRARPTYGGAAPERRDVDRPEAH